MKRLAGMMLVIFCLTGACAAWGETADGGWSDLYAMFVETAIEYGDLQEEWAKRPDVYAPAPQGAEIRLEPASAELSGDIRLIQDVETELGHYPFLYKKSGAEEKANRTALDSGDNDSAALWRVQVERPGLYENNMSFSLPVDTSVSSNSPGALRGFTMLLLQMGGAYYRGEGEASGLDTPEAYQAFKAWTDMYANYEIDAESNFFTRIRTGTMPIGIGNFTTYMQLMTSAPELYGRWSIAPVPGTRQADGTVKHTVGTTAATADIILAQSEKQDAAWQFLKWWSSEETQTRYGWELEAILGMGARWNTANVNAFYSLPWDARHERVIKAQMDAAEEQMIVPGGYFTGRHIINAWNRVCINNENVRDALEKAVKDINKELQNKRMEFGLE